MSMTVDELKEIYASFPPETDNSLHASIWSGYLHSFRKHVENDDIKEFLRWPTIRAVMFVGNVEWVHDEVDALMGGPLTWPRWRHAIREDSFGTPARLPWMLETSGNMIHQAYHLFQWEQTTGKTVDGLNRIVEFGGGYGAMARIIRRLGFKGEYIIYDLPELAALQSYYLSNVGVPSTIHVTNGNDFHEPPEADLLISCYSLGEAPAGLRDAFLEHPFRSYLIASQDEWEDRNLYEFFNGFMDVHPELKWKTWPNPFLGGHYYWMGYQ